MRAKLPAVSTRQAVKAFEKAGFVPVAGRGKGSHTVMAKDDCPAILTIPDRKELKRGTLRSLIRQAGMTVEEFVALL